MGAGIAATNAPELARRLRSVRTQLDDWLADLEATPDDLTATADPNPAPAERRPADADRRRMIAGLGGTILEQVLVVPRACVIGQTGWHGFRTGELDGLYDAVVREARYESRDAVESDPRWKQVIPYLVVRDGPRYFLMQRSRAGADARLHDRWSIGVGGHVNPGDGGIVGGLQREWREEIDSGVRSGTALPGPAQR